MRVLSWNLLRESGAGPADVAALVRRHDPDLVLLQEATAGTDGLRDLLGGHYRRARMAGRGHGPALWSSRPWERVAEAVLPVAGRLDLPVPICRSLLPRTALVARFEGIEVANVHLDHGQWANRRQLRHLAASFPGLRVVIGDFNAVGAATLPGFRDVGPRRATHRAEGIMPLRLDRCLVRDLSRVSAVALCAGASDHRPILVELAAMPSADREGQGAG